MAEKITEIVTRFKESKNNLKIITKIPNASISGVGYLVYLDFIDNLIDVIRKNKYLTLNELYLFSCDFLHDRIDDDIDIYSAYHFIDNYVLDLYSTIVYTLDIIDNNHEFVGYQAFGKNVMLIFETNEEDF